MHSLISIPNVSFSEAFPDFPISLPGTSGLAKSNHCQLCLNAFAIASLERNQVSSKTQTISLTPVENCVRFPKIVVLKLKYQSCESSSKQTARLLSRVSGSADLVCSLKVPYFALKEQVQTSPWRSKSCTVWPFITLYPYLSLSLSLTAAPILAHHYLHSLHIFHTIVILALLLETLSHSNY